MDTLVAQEIFLLDMSGFIFRAYFALPTMVSPEGKPVQGVFGATRSLLWLLDHKHPHYVVAVFDGPNNKASRQEIYADYKGNRTQQYPDIVDQIHSVKEFCQLKGIHCVSHEGIEADDVIATYAEKLQKQGHHVRICSSDKDLLQLVNDRVTVLHPWKEYEEWTAERVVDRYGVTPEQIPDYLALVGDKVDNIPGIPGCGPKKAAALLQQYYNIERLVSEVDRIPGKLGKTIGENQQTLNMSKRLASLENQVSVDVNLEECALREGVDLQQLNQFYERHGFQTLVVKHSVTESDPREHDFVIERIQVISPDHMMQLHEEWKGKEVAFAVAYSGNALMDLDPLGVAFCCDAGKAYYLSLIHI